MDRSPGLLRDLELDRSPSLFLNHGATIPHPAAGAYVVHLQADEIAASELAVDRKVEQGEISLPTLQLKPNPNGPDIFRLERRFWPIKRLLFQGAGLQGTGNGVAVCMVASSIPTAHPPSARR
jgi:hypothetical protein